MILIPYGGLSNELTGRLNRDDGRLKAGRIANATGSRETPIVKDLTLNQQPASFEKKLL